MVFQLTSLQVDELTGKLPYIIKGVLATRKTNLPVNLSTR